MGNRPSTPDGLPRIGFASVSNDIVHASAMPIPG